MDLSRFTIDPALARSADIENPRMSAYIDRLFGPLFEKDENLFARAELSENREILFSAAALHWLGSGRNTGRGKRALYLSFEPEAARKAFDVACKLGASLGSAPRLALALPGGAMEGEADPTLLFADIESFGATGAPSGINHREFGFFIADQAELIAELPGERQRKLLGGLLPSWERKTLVIAGKHTPRAKNLAWDIADNPAEVKLSDSLGFATTAPTVSRDLAEPDKIRYVLMLARNGERQGPVCVFCNLKSTAIELSIRLGMNGLGTDYITGNLNPDRKNQIVDKALGYSGGSFVLVLTDDGAKGIARPVFPTLVNYDIPLEPEFYFERLSLLDRNAPAAKVYNLVDERYMYGIPAIERAVDTSLGVTSLQAGEILPEDSSAGKRIEMPEPRMRGRDGRRGGRDNRDDRGREDRRDFSRRDDDNRGQDRRDNRPSDDRDRRPGRPDRSPRAGDRRTDSRAPEARGPEQHKDPYAMSMEERLAYYRRKYGSMGEKAPAAGRKPHNSAAPIARQPNPAAESAPAKDTPARDNPAEDSGDDAKSRGFLGKLQDIFGSRKE